MLKKKHTLGISLSQRHHQTQFFYRGLSRTGLPLINKELTISSHLIQPSVMPATKNVYDLLYRHYHAKGSKGAHTHLRMPNKALGTRGGAFALPDDPQTNLAFFTQYARTVASADGKGVHILESCEEFTPLKVDLDMLTKGDARAATVEHLEAFAVRIMRVADLWLDPEDMRVWTNEMIADKFINKLPADLLPGTKLPEYTNFPRTALVFRRPSARVENGNTKDGAHLIFPYLVASSVAQQIIRGTIIDGLNSDIREYREGAAPRGSGDLRWLMGQMMDAPAEIYDEASARAGASWTMYGSDKPGKVGNPYGLVSVIHIGSVHGDYDIRHEDPESYMGRIDRSIPETEDMSPAMRRVLAMAIHLRMRAYRDPRRRAHLRTNFVNDPLFELSAKAGGYSTSAPTEGSSGKESELKGSDIEYALALVACLAVSRVVGYRDWWRVGQLLANIAPSDKHEEFLEAWIELSKKSPRHTQDAAAGCRRRWPELRIGAGRCARPLRIGSLVAWAKEDNRKAFLKVRRSHQSRRAEQGEYIQYTRVFPEALREFVGPHRHLRAEYFISDTPGSIAVARPRGAVAVFENVEAFRATQEGVNRAVVVDECLVFVDFVAEHQSLRHNLRRLRRDILSIFGVKVTTEAVVAELVIANNIRFQRLCIPTLKLATAEHRRRFDAVMQYTECPKMSRREIPLGPDGIVPTDPVLLARATVLPDPVDTEDSWVPPSLDEAALPPGIEKHVLRMCTKKFAWINPTIGKWRRFECGWRARVTVDAPIRACYAEHTIDGAITVNDDRGVWMGCNHEGCDTCPGRGAVVGQMPARLMPISPVVADEVYDSRADGIYRQDAEKRQEPVVQGSRGLAGLFSYSKGSSIMVKKKHTLGIRDSDRRPCTRPYDELQIGTPKILVAEEQLGLGKTHQMREYLDTIPLNASVLIVQHRRSLATETVRRLRNRLKERELVERGFSYDLDEGSTKTPDRLVCQVDSIIAARSHYDYIVIDEIESVLRQVTGALYRAQVHRRLASLCRSAEHVLLLDGTAGRNTHRWLSTAVRRPFHWRRNTATLHPKRKFVFLDDRASALVTLKKLFVNKKQNLAIACASKKHAVCLVEFLQNKYKSAGDDEPPTSVRTPLAEGEVVLLTADTPKEERTRILENVGEATKNARLFVYSPTITAGCSIDHDRFHSVICWCTTRSVVADVLWQMIWRVRNPTTEHVYIMNGETDSLRETYRIPHVPHDTTVARWRNPERAREYLVEQGKSPSTEQLRRVFAEAHPEDELDPDGLWTLNTLVYNDVDNRWRDMRPLLEAHIAHADGIIEERTLKPNKKHKLLHSAFASECADYEPHDWVAPIVDADDITPEAYDGLIRRRRKGLSAPDKAAVKRYELRQAFGTEFSPTRIWVEGYMKHRAQFRRLRLMAAQLAASDDNLTQSEREEAIATANDLATTLYECGSSKNSSKPDGRYLKTGIELVRALGFESLLSSKYITKKQFDERKLAAAKVLNDWHKSWESDGIGCVVQATNAFLKRAFGLGFAQIWKKQEKRYAIGGLHIHPRPTYSRNTKKHKKGEPMEGGYHPIWRLSPDTPGQYIQTRFRTEADIHKYMM